jgi:hypothetical protein
VIKYLRSTPDLPLTLGADDVHIVKWWVDASYGIHIDICSHTGGTMSLGKGSIFSTSTRQKLNSKSSTEAELVGVSAVLSQVLWTQYFVEAQGYGVDDNIIYQDNMSAILLEKNGKLSSSRRTRHINIRYFFIADRVAQGKVPIEHCGTDDMLGDFFTKPVQGAKFIKFRNLIMNVSCDVVLVTSCRILLTATPVGYR